MYTQKKDIRMEVNFGSTYRIPITERGIGKAQKNRLRGFIQNEGGLAPASSGGACRISVPAEKDASIEQGLKQIGYRIWQKFSAHDVSTRAVGDTTELDIYIKNALAKDDYQIVGANKPKKRVF